MLCILTQVQPLRASKAYKGLIDVREVRQLDRRSSLSVNDNFVFSELPNLQLKCIFLTSIKVFHIERASRILVLVLL